MGIRNNNPSLHSQILQRRQIDEGAGWYRVMQVELEVPGGVIAYIVANITGRAMDNVNVRYDDSPNMFRM